MRDYQIWHDELVSEVRTISDATELERLWSARESDSVSSFAEDVAHVFDDFDIDGFLSDEKCRARFNGGQLEALRMFRDKFARYVDLLRPGQLATIDYKRVLDDPKWSEVVGAAHAFIELYDQGRAAS
jgi:hypothetical protein